MSRSLVVCGLLLVAVFVVFGQTAGHGFVNFDDDLYVYENRHVQEGLNVEAVRWAITTWHSCNWHPLTWLSHMLDCRFFGLTPGGHHLSSVLLHAVAAILLFLSLRRLTASFWPSAWVAAVFAIHPLRVESVAWVAERKDVLGGLFFTLTLWFYSRYAERPASWGRYFLLVASFALGLAAKPMLVTLPFVLLLLDYWPLKRFEGGQKGSHADKADPSWPAQRFVRLVVEKTPLFVLALASCAVTLAAQRDVMKPLDRMDFPWRVANAAVAYVTYLGKMLYPAGLAVFYPLPKEPPPAFQIVAAVTLLLAISMAVYAVRQKQPYLLLGWLWYLGTLAPVIGLVQVGSQALADRYTYLTQIGLYMALAWGAADVVRSWSCRHWPLATLAALAITGMMVCAWQQTRHWRDSEALWTHALACTSRNWIAHNSLGNAMGDRGEEDQAIFHYRKAVEIAPDYASARNNLGRRLVSRGQFVEAVTHCQKAVDVNPDFAEAHSNLGSALAGLGKVDEAIDHYRKALNLRPDLAEAHNNFGNALAGQGKADEAIAHYCHALEFKPDFAEAHNNLGAALAARGKVDEAIDHYRHALDIKPDLAKAQSNLGSALTGRGRFDEAIEHCRKALEIKPDFAEAHYNLGYALASCGKTDEAITHYQDALAIEPDLAEALYGLGSVLTGRGQVEAAIAQYRRAVKIKPDYAEAHNDLGTALASRGQVDEAMAHYEKALAIEPDFAQAHYNLGCALAGRGRVEAAIAHYEKALAVKPDYADVHTNLGNLLVKREQFEAAIVHYRKALAIDPKNVKAHFNLGAALEGSGKREEALQQFQMALGLASTQNDSALAEVIRERIKLQQSPSPTGKLP
jgi:protein O-mannosyl-transferase